MDNFFTAVKIIAYIISKIIALYFCFVISFAVTAFICGVTGIEDTPIELIFAAIFAVILSCTPTMIIVKINDYSSRWIKADIIVTTLILSLIVVFLMLLEQ